ncbi:MAG: hypothetical protein RIS47_2011 [Bacteroidota bacterium]|jgi:glutathione peroxidase
MKTGLTLIATLVLAVGLFVAFVPVNNNQKNKIMDNTIYQFKALNIEGKEVSLSDYKGKVVIIVNVASKCGFTPQYEGLEALYQKHKDAGLVILGFPCNQFGSQESGSEADIKSFCSLTYGVDFPMFSKIDVNGDNAHPLYKFLKDEKPGLLGIKAIKWNFTKFLINKEGKVVDRFAPQTSPADLDSSVVSLL